MKPIDSDGGDKMNEDERIDLREVISRFPACRYDQDKMRAALAELYPNSAKGLRSVIAAMMTGKILEEIANCTLLRDMTVERWMARLESEYGLAPKYTIEAISLWYDYFSVSAFEPVPEATDDTVAIHRTLFNMVMDNGGNKT